MKICDKGTLSSPIIPNVSFSMSDVPVSYVCLFSYFFRVKSEIIQDFLRLCHTVVASVDRHRLIRQRHFKSPVLPRSWIL